MPEHSEDEIEILTAEDAEGAMRSEVTFSFLANYVDVAFADVEALPPALVFEITTYLQEASEHPVAPPPHLVDTLLDFMHSVARPVENGPDFAEVAEWVRNAFTEIFFGFEPRILDPVGTLVFTNALARKTLAETLKEILEFAKRLIDRTKRLEMPDSWNLAVSPFRRSGPFQLLATDTLVLHASARADTLRPSPGKVNFVRIRKTIEAPRKTVMVSPNILGTSQYLMDKPLPRNLKLPANYHYRATDHYSGESKRLFLSFSSLLSRDVKIQMVIRDSYGFDINEPDKNYMSFVNEVRLDYWGWA
ncbi:MAG: hypothetical protein AAGA88_09265 [Pseudomonadota bacterium]